MPVPILARETLIPRDANAAQEIKTLSKSASRQTCEINNKHKPEDATASDSDSGSESGLEHTRNVAGADRKSLVKGVETHQDEGDKTRSDEEDKNRLHSASAGVCLFIHLS